MFRKLFIPLTILILSLFSAFPLFHSGLPPTHDGEYHVVRFYEFYRVLTDGSIYPRWAPDLNNGYGIPLLNFVYPLPNYTASLLHFLGFSFIDSFKLNMIFAIFVGAIFMYLWSKEFFGKWGGLVSSAFYTFSPYHFLDIYIRGSVGEVWALALFPAFLWSITKFVRERDKRFFVFSSLSLALIIFSHNILALMFFIFSLFYIVFLIIQENRSKYSPAGRHRLTLYTLYVILIGLSLSSVFWLPALFEKQFVKGLEVYDYSRNFPELYQLLIPSWGSGFSGSLDNQLSFQIGIANLFAVFASMFLIFKKNFRQKKMVVFFLGAFILVFLLMLKISKPIWTFVPFMNYFQFPWRFLSLEIFICSFLAGSLVFFGREKTLPAGRQVFALVLIVLTVLLGIGYTTIPYYLERSDSYYTTRQNFIDGTNSPGNAFSTIWFKNQPKTKEKLNIPKEEIISENIKSTSYSFNVQAKKKREVMVNTAYFPRWSVYVDEQKVRVSGTPEGLFKFNLGRGKHSIVIKFEDTYVRSLGTFLFFLSIFILLFVWFKGKDFVTIKGKP